MVTIIGIYSPMISNVCIYDYVYIYIIIYIYTNLSYCLIFEDLRYLFPQKFRDHPWPWFADARSRLSLRQGFVFSFACKAANGCGKLEGHGRIMIRNHRGKKRRFRRERRRVHSSFSNIICLVPFFFHIEISRHHKTPIIEFRGRQEIYAWYPIQHHMTDAAVG